MSLFFWPPLGQEKQYRQAPDAKDQTGSRPEIFGPAAMAGNNAAKNRIEKVDQCRRAKQGRRVDIWSKKNKSGKIT
jgi:hypothetical protein